MKIPLNQFEQYIDETILKRGLTYFKKGNVVEVEEIDSEKYEATVDGSEIYTVRLKISKGMIEDAACNCPYDAGPFCKHIAAVLFFIQKEELVISRIKNSGEVGSKKPKTALKKSVSILEKVRDVLDHVPQNELKQFIALQCENSTDFRNLVLATFANPRHAEPKSFYSKQIKLILRSASGREKFIFRNKSYQVAQQVNVILMAAKKQAEQKNYLSAINIACAIMEEMCAALDFADDSDGSIGSFVNFAQELLFQLAKEPLTEDNRMILLNYALYAFEKNIFEGWDWHLDMLKLASTLIKDESEAKKILKLLPGLESSKYHKEQAQIIEYEIIHKINGDLTAQQFLEKHLDNSTLRATAINHAIELLDFAHASQLAKDGIQQDEKSYPGLVVEWYNWLLKIAQAEGNKENIIKYARFLYIKNFRPTQDYYQVLKTHISEEDRPAFMFTLAKELCEGKTWVNIDLIAKIYIQEKWWPRLLDVLKQHPSLNEIENYEKYLAKDYANDLIVLYAYEIKQHLEHFTGKSHYVTVCKYIRRMIKLGGITQAEILIAELRIKYKQRKTLLEELAKV
ncbi:MAG TPA: SWIM zinc finger family protein [Saprospiraceae bacterium]|nr:SWIM zinc finger family protein [Saprospiraceae bacterium]HRG22043.1 SWIM zinc finger family protein [Saprospiraceae bacterium]